LTGILRNRWSHAARCNSLLALKAIFRPALIFIASPAAAIAPLYGPTVELCGDCGVVVREG
jgi:hypothetical protein